MSTTGFVAVTEGSGKNSATFEVTEDAKTKFLQRVPIAGSDGSDISGTTADAAYSGTGAGSWTAIFKWIGASLVLLLARFPTAIGQAAKAASLSVSIASDDDIQGKLGIVTETAPASDTASSGLNGRLQRVAQRLTSLIALLPAALGQTTKTGSLSVVHASDDPVVAATGTTADAAWSSGNGSLVALLKAIATNALSTTPSAVVGPGSYETVAASASAQVMGTTGAIGDFLSDLLIVPATTSPGAVSVQDGSGGAITVFAGGASSVSNLAPVPVKLGMASVNGAWKVNTGTNVSVIAIGKFS